MLSRPEPKKNEALRPARTGTKEVVKSKVLQLVERRERESLLAHAEREIASHHLVHGRVLAKSGVRPGVTITIAHDVVTVDEPLGPRTFFVTDGAIVQAPLAPPSGPSAKTKG